MISNVVTSENLRTLISLSIPCVVIYFCLKFFRKSITLTKLIQVLVLHIRHKFHLFHFLVHLCPNEKMVHIKIKWLNINLIFINNLEMGKQVMGNPVFAGRTTNPIWTIYSGGNFGLAHSMGEAYMEQKKFIWPTLNRLGLATQKWETLIDVQVNKFIYKLREINGQKISPNFLLEPYLSIPMWTLVAGTDFLSQHGNELVNLVHMTNRSWKEMDEFPNAGFKTFNRLPLSTRTLQHVITFLGGFKATQFWLVNSDKVRIFIDKIIEHNRHLNSMTMPESTTFVQAYLNKIEETTDAKSSFHGEQGLKHLKGFLGDLMYALTGSPSKTFARCVLHLVRNPKIQENIRREVNQVVPQRSIPSLSHRSSCPYTEAFIWEVLRESTPFATGLPHIALQDTQIGDHLVEKGTSVFVNLPSIHRNEKIWGDPNEFRPERFLDQNGNFSKSPHLIPFYVGLRTCAGQKLVQENLFKFVTVICQNFEIHSISNDISEIIPTLDRDSSAVCTSKPFVVEFHPI